MDVKMMHEMIEKLTECAKSEMDKKGIEEIDTDVPKVGSPWLGWILTLLLWPAGVAGVLFLLFLYPGKDAANSFGESPYSPAK